MTEEQNKEVMRLADEIADYAWKEGLSDGAYSNAKDDRECRADSRTELEAYLRTIWIASQASNTFPINPNGASKWAHLQKHDGAEAIGVVFRTGSGSVGSLVDGRVVWADWLAHPNGSKPEGVNAELLEALKECMKWQAEGEFGDPLSEEYWSPAYKEFMGKTKEAIARAESAIETPAKVSPCAGHAVQQDADLRQIVGIKEAVAGIAEFFEGEYHSGITGIVDASKVRGERVEDECRPEFDHCYVTQGGGGFDGDDFHGTVYFHIGNGEYATVDY